MHDGGCMSTLYFGLLIVICVMFFFLFAAFPAVWTTKFWKHLLHERHTPVSQSHPRAEGLAQKVRGPRLLLVHDPLPINLWVVVPCSFVLSPKWKSVFLCGTLKSLGVSCGIMAFEIHVTK